MHVFKEANNAADLLSNQVVFQSLDKVVESHTTRWARLEEIITNIKKIKNYHSMF